MRSFTTARIASIIPAASGDFLPRGVADSLRAHGPDPNPGMPKLPSRYIRPTITVFNELPIELYPGEVVRLEGVRLEGDGGYGDWHIKEVLAAVPGDSPPEV